MSVGEFLAAAKPQISYSFWASPGQNQTLGELEKQLIEAGNQIIEVDEEHDRILIARWQNSDAVWGCILCHMAGATVLFDGEGELTAHADADHPGWRA